MTAASATAEPLVGPQFYRPDFPIADLRKSPLNPRKTFDDAKLRELADSIAGVGVIEPLVARSVGDHYEIVCGERRFRAAQLAGLASVPVTVKSLTDAQALEIMVIENNQREDVNPLEEADGFSRLMQSGWEVEHLASRLGRSKKYVYDRVKLLQLVPAAQQLVLGGVLTAGHAILLARLEPKMQARAIDPNEYELFVQDENVRVPSDERHANPYAGKTVCSVRQFAGWIDDNVPLNLKKPIDGELFPAAAAAHREEPETIVSISNSPFDGEISKGVLGAREWKRADGTRGPESEFTSKEVTYRECDKSVTGVVVLGWGRGDAFKVCVDRKCDVHWKKERQQPATPGDARLSDEERKRRDVARKRQEAETRKWREKQQQEAAERERLKKHASSVFEAAVKAVKAAPISRLGEYLVAQHGDADKRAAAAIGVPKSAQEFLWLLVLADLSAGIFNSYPHVPSLARDLKRVGLNLLKLLPADAVQTSAKPSKAAKSKKRKKR